MNYSFINIFRYFFTQHVLPEVIVPCPKKSVYMLVGINAYI